MTTTVLMSADPRGGVWTYAMDLCRAYAEYDVDVVLATLGAPLSLRQRHEVATLNTVTLEEWQGPLQWTPDPWRRDHETGEWLVDLARGYRVDVVHLNQLTNADLEFDAPVLSVAHSCALSRAQAISGGELSTRAVRYRRDVAASLRAADAVVAVSHAMADDLHNVYGSLPDTVVIRNARPPAPLVSRSKRPLVLTVGCVRDRAKNSASVVRVAAQLPWPVCVVSPDMPCDDDADRAPVLSAVERENVHFTGELSQRELSPWYAGASIFAHPALYEPCGLSVLEAAHAGCALVLGDIPSLREQWHGAALFVDPRDERALVTAIRTLVRDGERRERLAAAARRRAADRSFDHMVREYLLAYRLLQGGYASLFDGVREARAS